MKVMTILINLIIFFYDKWDRVEQKVSARLVQEQIMLIVSLYLNRWGGIRGPLINSNIFNTIDRMIILMVLNVMVYMVMMMLILIMIVLMMVV